MEPVQMPENAAVSRRLQTLTGHFASTLLERGSRLPGIVTAEVCAELAAVRACRRTKDVVYYTRPVGNEEGEERVRRCKTTHQVVSREFILNGRSEAGSNPQARPAPGGTSASLPAVGAKDDDILPPSLVYLDSWLPETAASYSQKAPRRDREPRLREAVDQHSLNQNQATGAQHLNPARGTDSKAVGHHGGKGTCGGVRNRQDGLGAGSMSAARSALANLGAEWEPKMDVLESPKSFVVSLELPGVPVEGVRVELREGSLVITGSRPPQAWSNIGGHITFAPADERSGQAVYHRRELAQGPYHASWAVPEGCDYDGVSAEFVDGVLSVVLPKKATSLSKKP